MTVFSPSLIVARISDRHSLRGALYVCASTHGFEYHLLGHTENKDKWKHTSAKNPSKPLGTFVNN